MIMVADEKDLHDELDWARQRRKSQVCGVRRFVTSPTSWSVPLHYLGTFFLQLYNQNQNQNT